RAAIKGLTIYLAREVNRDAVGILSGTAFLCFVFSALLAQDVNGFLNLVIAHINLCTRDLKLGELGNIDLGIDFEGGGKSQLLFVGLFFLGLETGRACDAQLGFLNDGLQPAANFGIDDVVANACAMTALNQGERRLAGPKTLHLGGTRNTPELRQNFFLDFGRGNDQINTALQGTDSFDLGLHGTPICKKIEIVKDKPPILTETSGWRAGWDNDGGFGNLGEKLHG